MKLDTVNSVLRRLGVLLVVTTDDRDDGATSFSVITVAAFRRTIDSVVKQATKPS